MKKVYWFFIFTLVLLAHLLGIQVKDELLQNISKPLLIPALTGYFIFSLKDVKTSIKKWVIAALFFSWAGDILLMFQIKDEIFFLLGLSSFLLAHIFYIILFHRIRILEKIKGNPWLLLLVVIYYAALLSWLSPYLGDMKLPVRIYGIVISFMFMLAMHMLFARNRTAGRWMMGGALLFVISDSVLAINKFYQSFELAGISIMLTYGLAQLCIVRGAISYITENKK